MLKTRGQSVEIKRETCSLFDVFHAELNQADDIYSVSLALHFGLDPASFTTSCVLVLYMPNKHPVLWIPEAEARF